MADLISQSLELKKAWSQAHVNTLDDTCFLYIEDGGTKDENNRTVPRSKRHLPIRGPDGKLDIPHLRAAISRLGQDGTLPGLDDARKAQLQARARRLLAQAQPDGGKTADLDPPEPPEWQSGAALALYGLGARLQDLGDQAAGEHKAMRALDEDTKDYCRLRAPLREQARAVATELGKLLDFAEAIERGDDGRQRVAWYRAQLALSDV